MNTNSFNLGAVYAFHFDGIDGMVRCYPSGAREVSYGGMLFEFEAASAPLKLAIEKAIKR